MKTKLFVTSLIVLLGIGLSVAIVSAQGPAPRKPSAAMGTAFTYQGQLKKSGAPVSSTCTFTFGLWDAASGGTQLGSNQTVGGVSVSNGLFTAQVNGGNEFLANAFNGNARWLDISAQCTGDGSPTSLGRQQLTAAPYALALPGLYTQQNATSPNLIGGYSGNTVTSGVYGATIGGGGASGNTNRVTDDYGTVGGGGNNQAGNNDGNTSNTIAATIGGGYGNIASGGNATIGGGQLNSTFGAVATIGGGQSNSASGNFATIGGGKSNTASGAGAFVGGGGYDGITTLGNTASGNASTVGGGTGNTTSGIHATIGGGSGNTASNYHATIPGGYNNTAAGQSSFAAGYRARANHTGAFVWGDYSEADIASTAINQFVIRATNGVSLTVDAGSTKGINVGDRYRDNAIVAWASVYWNGNIDQSFGVQSVTKLGTGQYRITLYASAASEYGLIPVATPEIDTAPTSAAALRIVSINQINSKNIFEVYINDGTGNLVDNDFIVIVTAR
jgi:hypothetical protein